MFSGSSEIGRASARRRVGARQEELLSDGVGGGREQLADEGGERQELEPDCSEAGREREVERLVPAPPRPGTDDDRQPRRAGDQRDERPAVGAREGHERPDGERREQDGRPATG